MIRRQPPNFIFPDETFDVFVGLEVTRLTGDSPAGTEVELTASLLVYKEGDQSPPISDDTASVLLFGERNTVTANNTMRNVR